QDLVHYRVEAVFSDGILYISVRMEEKRGGQVGQDRNDGISVHGSDGPPSRKPGQHQGRNWCSPRSRGQAQEGSPLELSITLAIMEVPT
ncbi:MAG: hypothetical protein DRI91_03785, partial [Aquificota bacterium]